MKTIIERNRYNHPRSKRMGLKTFTSVLLLSLASISAIAQESPSFKRAKKEGADSVLRVEEKQNSDNLSDLKSNATDTRAKAKEAQRVERNANNAAKESDAAYRTEQKAQKARKKADRQAKKAAKARVESNKD